jgi:hypothetical protein
MSEEESIVRNFIFDDEIQDKLSVISNSLMDFNILEITGMGAQEIKHSNILGWLLNNSEHNLEYTILENFLKKVISENNNTKLLQRYAYLPKNKRNIKIYREEDNIDLLIVDDANKVVIIIENKVFASERINGDDGGQLKKYEKTINIKYNGDYQKHFIFLTIDLKEPSKGENQWLKANHQMITDVLEEILKNKNDLSIKTKIIFESYIDLLKRKGIIMDKELNELCKEIWEQYGDALNILIKNRPNARTIIENIIKNSGAMNIQPFSQGDSTVYIFVFDNNSPVKYVIQYSTDTKKIKFTLVSDEEFGEMELMDMKFSTNNQNSRWKYKYCANFKELWNEDDIIKDPNILKDFVDKLKDISIQN